MTNKEILARMVDLLETIENLRENAETYIVGYGNNRAYFEGKEYAYTTVHTILQEELTSIQMKIWKESNEDIS